MWWVRFLNFARDDKEKNVELFRENNAFYCSVVKDVPKGEELLVWFNEKLGKELGIRNIEKKHEKGMLW